METPYQLLKAYYGDTIDDVLLCYSVESNRIEGEEHTRPREVTALRFLLEQETINEAAIKYCHNIYAKGRLEYENIGQYRREPVTVGKYVPPVCDMVPGLMGNLILDLPKLSSHEAHIRFEKIHPFVDLNGRVGRALWAYMVIKEGYLLQYGFLHEWYYQSLRARQ